MKPVSLAKFVTTLTVALAVPCAYAQTPQPPTASSPAPVQVQLAINETREVVAEGRAAIGDTGVLGARRAATAQALRNAVERAIGVYVSARTLTQNYTLIRDQVTTRAEGFATLKEVLSERIGTQEVAVKVRAVVSLRPLAAQLKGLGLTRAWRVRVTPDKSVTEPGNLTSAQSVLEQSLTEAGFVVVSSDKEADLRLTLSPRLESVSSQNVQSGNIAMTMYGERGNLTVRATRAGTGEVVASATGSDTALHINRQTAQTEALSDAAKQIAPRLADALMVLPAASSQPVTLVVSRLPRATDVGKLEDTLNTLVGVQSVTRRSFASGTATWELSVLTEAASSLARELERPSTGLTVSSESRSKIVAARKPAKP